jgi:hypothetical protein
MQQSVLNRLTAILSGWYASCSSIPCCATPLGGGCERVFVTGVTHLEGGARLSVLSTAVVGIRNATLIRFTSGFASGSVDRQRLRVALAYTHNMSLCRCTMYERRDLTVPTEAHVETDLRNFSAVELQLVHTPGRRSTCCEPTLCDRLQGGLVWLAPSNGLSVFPVARIVVLQHAR